MSNVEASKLYEAIIEEVISDSRQDFEDSGIDESTLQDLRKIWCEKLSQSGVSRFTWDDEQINAYEIDHNQLPQHSEEPTGGVLGDNSLPLDTGSVLELPNMQSDSQLSYNTTGLSSNNNSDIQIPNIDPTPKEEYYDNGTGLMLPRINQADGTFEFTMHTDQATNIMNKLKNNRQGPANKNISQADGNDDDDNDDDDDIFNDSDDINSDLDEGLESEKSDEEDGDQEGQIMLCLYDKVQRVKNKWKSNLKEGVANINGRDYVFQKATGESEW